MILTEQEIRKIQTQHPTENNPMPFARAIESAVLKKLKAQKPFGYFKAEPFGWTDCAETDDGAKPLYEHPLPPDDVVRDAERYRWLRDVGCYEFKPFVQSWMKTANECDAAIDAAIKVLK